MPFHKTYKCDLCGVEIDSGYIRSIGLVIETNTKQSSIEICAGCVDGEYWKEGQVRNGEIVRVCPDPNCLSDAVEMMLQKADEFLERAIKEERERRPTFKPNTRIDFGPSELHKEQQRKFMELLKKIEDDTIKKPK